MKKLHSLVFVLTLPVLFASTAVNAALATDAFLNFDPGIPNPSGDAALPTSGSYFGMEISQSRPVFYTTISQFAPLKLGVIQPASGSRTGSPNGMENPGIDNPWIFFSNTGMHETSTPVTILSDDSSGNVTLDFSGWGIDWNTIPFISLGGSPDFPDSPFSPGDTGVATIACGSTCEIGDSFVLDYAAHVYDLPGNESSGFNNVPYSLHLEGTISTVPVPAAAWLFGSGLLGLIGVARRKKA